LHSAITAEAIEAAGREQEADGVPPLTGQQLALASLLLSPHGDTDRRVRSAVFSATCTVPAWTEMFRNVTHAVPIELATVGLRAFH
jgi:hypothetical protein